MNEVNYDEEVRSLTDEIEVVIKSGFSRERVSEIMFNQ